MAEFARVSVLDALEESISAADHLGPKHAAVVGAARALAAKIDAWDVIVQWALGDAAESESRPKVPANDNTSLGTYSKYLDQLGLSVPAVKAGAAAPAQSSVAEPDTDGGESPDAKIMQMQQRAAERKAR